MYDEVEDCFPVFSLPKRKTKSRIKSSDDKNNMFHLIV